MQLDFQVQQDEREIIAEHRRMVAAVVTCRANGFRALMMGDATAVREYADKRQTYSARAAEIEHKYPHLAADFDENYSYYGG